MAIKKVILGLVLGAIVVGAWWGYQDEARDFRVGVVNDSGLWLETVSPSRKMINSVEIKGEVMVWVPRGMGWYRSDKIAKLLYDQEKRAELVEEVFFYNFGFVPDMVVRGETNWWRRGEVIRAWGWNNLIKMWVGWSKMMNKRETVANGLSESQEFLDQIMPRDMADSQLLTEEVRLTVYNLSQSNGLGGWLTRLVERSGMAVMGLDSPVASIEADCQISYAPGVEKSKTLRVLQKVLGECRIVEDSKLVAGEVELYFGDGYSKMINYESLKKITND